MAQPRKNFRKTNKGNYKKSFIPYPFQKNQNIELTIDGLTSQGHGVGRLNHDPAEGEPVENWVVFVPYTLPGEKVKARVTHNSKKNSLAELVEVITPSADRVEPVCRHFFYCGGCQLQHLNYDAQLVAKRDHLIAILDRITDQKLAIQPPIASPKIWNYRSKISPKFSKPEKDKIHSIGFHHHSDKQTIVDVVECPIAMEQLNEALPFLREAVKGRAKSITEQGTILMRVNEERVETEAQNVVSQKVNGINFYFLAKDFFQNNPSILPEFTSYVAKQASSQNAEFLIDAYCGSGLFALCLSNQFAKVVGIEVSPTSADWARYNADFNDITNVEIFTGKAEGIFENAKFDPTLTSVVIDPPRAGCDRIFLEQLFELGAKTVVYVSCDPGTQARDLEHFLAAGYIVEEVQPFDLFPHTRHLECVITFKKQS
ncbi:class I SAM-dependent RNA methyltransferase [Akkermansiaceae bacterium]|nr:class I SAM-dependent RNA methyltransferase [Akkermansiaceae bacterium]